jgi:hypothetical protein
MAPAFQVMIGIMDKALLNNEGTLIATETLTTAVKIIKGETSRT